MSMKLQIFIGYDPRQPVAYAVCAHSVATRLSVPAPITRLQLNQLPITRRGLTEFTYSRFLVPYLSGFDGYSLFLDADVVVLDDVSKLLSFADRSAAVSVVPHEGPLSFERGSVMLFNNKRCTALTPEFVDDPNNGLMDLKWAGKVGTLPKDWNHLVGYDAPNPSAKVVHFTMGVPVWAETLNSEHQDKWHDARTEMLGSVTFKELMGSSVHVQYLKRLG